jgi:putative DNA-invertase from lambdoid prophage Rac
MEPAKSFGIASSTNKPTVVRGMVLRTAEKMQKACPLGLLSINGQVYMRTILQRTTGVAMKTILYARVSTVDQTIEHQRTQAEAAGFKIDEVVADHGVSGVQTKLKDRPEGRRLFDLLRTGDVLIVRWVDRLGRQYDDIADTIREFVRRGVVIKTVINGMVFDGATKDPMQMAIRDALIAFMAAMSQAQAEATREAQRAGIEHAKGKGVYLGRKPSYSRSEFEAVQAMLAQDNTISTIAKTTGLTRQTIYRIQAEPVAAEAALTAWEM